MKKIGLWLIMVGVGAGLLETSYFGWNFVPGTLSELIADITCLAIVVTGIVMRIH